MSTFTPTQNREKKHEDQSSTTERLCERVQISSTKKGRRHTVEEREREIDFKRESVCVRVYAREIRESSRAQERESVCVRKREERES
jgi:hypothetical protein